MVIVPETAREIPEFMLNVLLAEFALKFIDTQDAFAVTVTICPPLIITKSFVVGIPVGLQVLLAFQFPVAIEV
jgi:hypothetical protein